MNRRTRILLCVVVALAASGVGTAHACEDGMLVDYGGQSCYEGWNDYRRAQPQESLATCPDWHDETPGALAAHCPLVRAPAAPESTPDWHDEAPRLLRAAKLPPPDIALEAAGPTIDEVTLTQRAGE